MRCLLVLWAVCFSLAGCPSTPSYPDAPGADASGIDAPLDARTGRCVGDDECSDGNFCNGRERCEPTSATADERGCVPSRGRPCLPAQVCEEATDTCVTDCGVSQDADGDGEDARVCGGSDCDDRDPLAYPGAMEVCDDENRDEDCDPSTFGGRDLDRDGSVSSACCNVSSTGARSCGDDCNDVLRSVRPTATETCNGRDDDCNGSIDEGVTVPAFADADRDLHGDPGAMRMVCPAAVGSSTLDDDCDDTSVAAHRAQVEICDALDNDCDGRVDEQARAVTWYLDADGDGFGSAASGTMVSCTPLAGYSLLPTDCDDGNPSISPAAPERCNGLDDDCNGLLDGSMAPGDFEDDDGDGHLDAACGGDDCDDLDWNAYAGAPEICDFRDSDCDGLSDLGRTRPAGAEADTTDEVDWLLDVDQDGWGAGTAIHSCEPQPGRTTRMGDCADEDLSRHPQALDVCNGRDDDCDAETDEDAVALAYYADGDRDGDGAGTAMLACRPPSGTSELPGDCADSNPARGPGAIETCNGADDDCDTRVDEELFRDADGDGHGDPAAPVTGTCIAGDVGIGDDCDDGDPRVGPSGTCAELCNGFDDDRDGMLDEGAEASCPNAATSTWACVDGACELMGCRGMAEDCNGSRVDGCERDTAVDPLACGTCSTTCDVGEACVGGVCDDPIVDIACGTDTTMALRSSGVAVAWGYGGAGVASSSGSGFVPVVTSVSSATALDLHYRRGCATYPGGRLCWGDQVIWGASILGDGMIVPVSTPSMLSAEPFSMVGVGYGHSCGVRADRRVLCWGGHAGGNLVLGDGSGVPSQTPVSVTGLGDATALALGVAHTCALRASGHVICWGANASGQLGNNTLTDRPEPFDEVVVSGGSALTNIVELDAGVGDNTNGSRFTCARTSSGLVQCWGYNASGALGRDQAAATGSPFAAPVVSGPGSTMPLMDVSRVELGLDFGCAQTSSGLVCWGRNTEGQLGIGSTTNTRAPVSVPGLPAFSDWCVGYAHACVLATDGRVLCWGDNGRGQAGQDSLARVTSPTEVMSLRRGPP